MSMKRSKARVSVIYILLFIYLIIAVFPVYFALISSVKDNISIFKFPFSFPKEFHFDNFSRALQVGKIDLAFRNSLILTGFTMALTGFIGTMSAYIFARFKFRIKNILFVFVIAGMMIPIQSTIIPLSFTFGKFGINNNYPVLILLFSGFQLPITVFIITSFLISIPSELEEAAVIDGCNAGTIFFRIIFPLSVPAISTASVFNFINVWNNLLFPLVFISKKNLQVIALALQSFFAERVSDYGGVMAAIVIAIIPTIVMYIFLQEKVEKGITAGAVKG